MALSRGLQALVRIGRNTADLDRAVAFHCDALGFRMVRLRNEPPEWTRLPGVEARPSRCAELALGAQSIELTEFPDAEPYPGDRHSCDLGFQHFAIAVDDMPAAHARVMQHGAMPITRGGPQTLPPSTGSVTAFKFRDPDGHPLELIAFPAGVGDPAWQAAGGACAPALGIDHSAISIGNVTRSVHFYQLLGLTVVARGINRGTGQQRLDDLEDPEVEVIAMKPAAARTPHLELLGYRKPAGRPANARAIHATAADRLCWRAHDTRRLLGAITASGFEHAIVACDFQQDRDLALLRDPDGHRLLIGSGP